MDHRSEYEERINRVLDYIDAHLDGDLSLETLARVAAFSPFHFHRIFGAMMGETLQRFIQRVRLERAATNLMHHPRRPVLDIALDAGFGSAASFARAFRQAFGMSATEWRQRKIGQRDRKSGQPARKLGEAGAEATAYRRDMNATKLTYSVDVNQRPVTRIAYLRHVGPYAGDAALFGRLFGELANWAGPRNQLRPERHFISIYHDNPEVTAPEKLRLSVGVPVDDDVEVSGKVGAMTLEAGAYAEATFVLDGPDKYGAAWQVFMGEWLPQSGYEPTDGLPFERYLNDPTTDPEGKHRVQLCCPVKPL
ncbi:MAG: AraC family transcriptional regulator [Myxococcota bacterium]